MFALLPEPVIAVLFAISKRIRSLQGLNVALSLGHGGLACLDSLSVHVDDASTTVSLLAVDRNLSLLFQVVWNEQQVRKASCSRES